MTTATTTTRDTLATVASRNIRTLMALRGVSQMQLADLVGISQTGVSKRLRGVTPFDLGDLEKIANVLGVRPLDLLDADLISPRALAVSGLPRLDSNQQPAGRESAVVRTRILPFVRPLRELQGRPVCTRPGVGSWEYPQAIAG